MEPARAPSTAPPAAARSHGAGHFGDDGAGWLLGTMTATIAPESRSVSSVGVATTRTVVFASIMVIVFNLLVDLLYAWIDPRVRLS